MDNIQSVKIKGNFYLLNDISYVPKVDGNIEYELIKQWLSEGNIPKPEFTEEELAQQVIDKQIAEYKTYLSNTDYKMLNNYVPKIDEDINAIIAQRNIAREYIRANNA